MSGGSATERAPAPRRRATRASAGDFSDVWAVQRARILLAAAEAARLRGARQLTVAEIVQRAGVSRRTFYAMYADREDCMLAAVDEAMKRAERRVLPAFLAQDGWRERLSAGLLEILCFLDEEPELGALIVIDSLALSDEGLRQRWQALRCVTDAVRAGQELCTGALAPDELTAEGVVGAVCAVLHRHLLFERRRSSVRLHARLMGMIVLPYLGRAAAAGELERAAPRRLPRREGASADPLRELPLRLTGRTLAVLAAIAARPGATNREVAAHAGVGDQGQASKLLARLARAGLIVNARAQPRSGPNAWSLTEAGDALQQAIRARTARG